VTLALVGVVVVVMTLAAAVSDRQRLAMSILATIAHLVLKEEVRRCMLASQ
jgi:hypothetical protein